MLYSERQLVQPLRNFRVGLVYLGDTTLDGKLRAIFGYMGHRLDLAAGTIWVRPETPFVQEFGTSTLRSSEPIDLNPVATRQMKARHAGSRVGYEMPVRQV